MIINIYFIIEIYQSTNRIGGFYAKATKNLPSENFPMAD